MALTRFGIFGWHAKRTVVFGSTLNAVRIIVFAELAGTSGIYKVLSIALEALIKSTFAALWISAT